MRSARPPYAPTGSPPPMILPRQVRSGRTSATACAPPGAARKPEITSSKISTVPCADVISRSARRNPSAGGTSPMLPAIGSTMSAAIWSRWASKTRWTDSRSL